MRDAAYYMARCLSLAARGAGGTSPNPMVGAVVVKGGRIVGTGYHERPGEPHAEAIALRRAGLRARGATLYVNLEPCCHTAKRTPPCAPVIIASGVRRVVVGMVDPNPKVSRRGIRTLRRAGIRVDLGTMEAEARDLNVAFTKHIRTGLPFTILKLGQSIDGKIATSLGESKWITGHESRRRVAALRASVSAVLVGIGTVQKDDPRLTARLRGGGGRSPVRIILDTRLRISTRSRCLRKSSGVRTIIATVRGASPRKIARLEAMGAEVWRVKRMNGRVDMREVARRIAREGLNTLLVEGGSETAASAIRSGIVDRLILFIAAKIIGGRDAVPSIGGRSPARLRQAVDLVIRRAERVGSDLMIVADVKAPRRRRRSP